MLIVIIASLFLNSKKSIIALNSDLYNMMQNPHKVYNNNFIQNIKFDLSNFIVKKKRKKRPHHYSMDCVVTSFSSAPEENGWGPITKLGTKLRRGIVAVDPRYIPLRSKVFVPGYGWATCEDTGSKIKGRHIDVFLSRHEMRRWGRKKLKIIVYPYHKLKKI